MSLLAGACIFLVIFTCANCVTGDAVLSSTKYDVLQTECSSGFYLPCYDSAPKTLTTGDCGCVELLCTDVNTRITSTYSVTKDALGLSLVAQDSVLYLVINNGDGVIYVKKTLRIVANGVTTFYALDASADLCVASLDASGKVVLTAVTRQSTGYTPPSVNLVLQEFIVLQKICTAPLPDQFTDATVKQITIQESGDLLLSCIYHETEKFFNYSISEDKVTGLFMIMENDKEYLIDIRNGGLPVGVKNMVRCMVTEQLVIYSSDDAAKLCTAHYDEETSSLSLIPVEKHSPSVTTRSVPLTSSEYSMYKRACTELLPEHFSSSSAMTVTVDTNGELVLRCVNAAQQVFVYKLFCTTEQQILVFEEHHVTYLVVVTEVNIITVKIAIRCKINEEIVFLVVDENQNLCTVWYDEKGVIQFKEVTKEAVGGFSSKVRSIDVTGQEYNAFEAQLHETLPQQFADSSVKTLTVDEYGNFQLFCIHPETKLEMVYNVYIRTWCGLYVVEENTKFYVIIVRDSVILVRTAVIFTAEEQTTLYVNDESGSLCTAQYDSNANDVKLTQVGRRTVKYATTCLTLDEKDYNKKLEMCSKQLAEQFTDSTEKHLLICENGELLLQCKYKRADFKFLVEVCRDTGFYIMLYKAKHYLVQIIEDTVYVKAAVVGSYEKWTVVYIANEGKLCSVSYDSQNNFVYTPVGKRTVEENNKQESKEKKKEEKSKEERKKDEKKKEENKKNKEATKENEVNGKKTNEKECGCKDIKVVNDNKGKKNNKKTVDENKKEQKKKTNKNVNEIKKTNNSMCKQKEETKKDACKKNTDVDKKSKKKSKGVGKEKKKKKKNVDKKVKKPGGTCKLEEKNKKQKPCEKKNVDDKKKKDKKKNETPCGCTCTC